MQPKLIFIYNADSGLFNLVSDIAHKIFSPSTYQCSLCQLAYGHFSVKQEWTEFLKDAPFESEFLHRDEFIKEHPDVVSDWPVVMVERDGVLEPCVAAGEINQCKSLDELKDLILDRYSQL